jgi:hypothetical protein
MSMVQAGWISRRARQAGLVLLIQLLLLACSACAQASLARANRTDLDDLAATYNIEIVTSQINFPVALTYGNIDGRAAEAKELDSYVGLFVQEFRIYPRSLVTNTMLKRVVLCKDLSYAGQRRNAVPDFEHDSLYLEVARGSYDHTYLRKVIHHEFFHIIDYRDDGSLYRDDRWTALNVPGFSYGTGGQNAQGIATSSVLTDQYPGFLDYYATTGVEEDKAEVFANLIVDPAYVESRTKTDPILRAKVQMMWELLRRFCPDMNDSFREKLKHIERK